MTDIRADYLALCQVLKDYSRLVVAVEDARYQAPPGMVVSKGEIGSNVADVSNPTLDTVIDPRRADLSEQAEETARALRVFAANLNGRFKRLDTALARWEGEKP